MMCSRSSSVTFCIYSCRVDRARNTLSSHGGSYIAYKEILR